MESVGNILGGLAAVRYHLFCPYHGGVGITTTPEEACKLAREHIKAQHVDPAGRVAPGAEVQIQMKMHVTSEHVAAAATPPAPAPESETS